MAELVQQNLLSPIVLAFVLGVVATLVKSDLRLPDELYASMSIYLLLAIGLKGGAELAHTPLAVFYRPAGMAIALGVVIPISSFFILRKLGRFSVPDAAALAAHYGSVSAVTFFAMLSFLNSIDRPAEGFMPTLLAIMEVPAIVIGLSLARINTGERAPWREVFHEILSGRSILLLLGGLAIGFLATRFSDGIAPVSPLFVDLFKGVLMLFLLEMGMVAARRLRDFARAGYFLIAFAIVMPIVHAVIGIYLGKFSGLGLGGAVVLGTLAASASYIAAPAAVRIALPQANPGYYLTASIGITFPFNLTVGIPLYYAIGKWMYGV